MYSESFFSLFIEVLKSWQVIVITIGLILLIFLVNYVARSYRPRTVSRSKPKKVRAKKQKKAEVSSGVEDNSNEALGLSDY